MCVPVLRCGPHSHTPWAREDVVTTVVGGEQVASDISFKRDPAMRWAHTGLFEGAGTICRGVDVRMSPPPEFCVALDKGEDIGAFTCEIK